jgi:NAD(P)-dependent dehydrogenase (short-subunit alcohol dehydrogenase family)
MTKWTAGDIPDLSGRNAVVTGANSGVGFEVALELAGHGAHVILACRNPDTGAAALVRVRARGSAELRSLDLAELSSVRTFAAGLSGPIALLVNNAGVMAIPRRETVDGFEMQFATNHLGHFALTGLLLPALLSRPGARVVTVSSPVAKSGSINLEDLHGTRRYRRWGAYGQSKLANQLFAFELDRRARAARLDLASLAAHPGYAATNLSTVFAGDNLLLRAGVWVADRTVAQSATAGALPILFAATAPGVLGGEYIGPDRFGGMRGHPTRINPVPGARGEDLARRLWAASEQMTGVSFPGLAG